MPDAEQWSIILHFRLQVVADALRRVLNDPITLDPRSDRYLPRRLDMPEPHTRLWWDQPALALDEGGHVVLSAALAGGVRQAGLPLENGRIASVDGTLRARTEPALAFTANAPHLTLVPAALDLAGLRIHYAGSSPLPLLDIGRGRQAVEVALVRDAAAALAAQPALSDFIGGLGRRPMSYVPATFPFQAAPGAVAMRVFAPKTGDAVVIGVARPGTQVDGALLSNALAGHDGSNAAITLSAAYLSSRLDGLLVSGHMPPSLWDNAGGELARIDALSLRPGVERLTLHGHVTRGAAGASLRVELGVSVDEDTGKARVISGQTYVELDTVRGEPDAAQDALAAIPQRLSRTYWQEVVAALLGGRTEGDAIDLTQRYVVPGTGVAVDAHTNAVEITPDGLTLYTAIRCDARFVPEPPRRLPQVTIVQQGIPSQAAPQTPVQATVAAEVVSESYPPYDYAWETEPALGQQSAHGQLITVRGTPLGTGDDPERIARVHVSLIDSFGQVAQHDTQVVAHPAQRRQEHQEKQKSPSRGPLKIVLPAALAIILVGSGVAVVFSHLGPKPPIQTPVIGVLPQTAYSQTCQPAVPTLPAIPVTLDNSGSSIAVTWQAAVRGLAPGSAAPWAAVDSASGTVPARSSKVVTITPATDLCSRLQGAAAPQVFSVTLTYSAAQQALAGGSREIAAVAQAAEAATSRQVTITDTIASISFSAYVVTRGGQNTTSINASCDANFALTPATFVVVLDNTKSSADASWQISISDNAAAATPAATTLPTPTPVPSATPLAPEPWAQATLTSGTLAAGQRSRMGIVPVNDLCSRIGPGTTPTPLRVLVTLGDGSTIPITVTVTPTPPVINFAVTVVDKAATSSTSIAQSCDALSPFTLALDNRASNMPVSWRVDIADTVYPAGTPTPAPGPAEVWATADITSGTVAPGANGVASVTITPASDLCRFFPSRSVTVDYSLVVLYGNGQQVTVTDAVTLNVIQ